jgi:hypothetical protein
MTASSSSSSLRLENLSNDILGSILLCCDFESACNVAQRTSQALQQQASSSQELHPIWKEIFDRHGFSSEDIVDWDDIIRICQQRRQLLFNLLQPQQLCPPKKKKIRSLANPKQLCQQKKKIRSLANLPHRYFQFMPIVPVDKWLLEEEEEEQLSMVDTPPIFYECDSFVLTSTATSPELLFLNPFDGSLTIFHNCLEHCVKPDDSENMMMNITTNPMDMEEDTSTATTTASPSTQTLLSTDDYFCFDIAPRFPAAGLSRNSSADEEYDMVYVGTESKPIFDSSHSTTCIGTMVAVGRSVRNLADPSIVCTELTSWTKTVDDKDGLYGHKRIVRSPYLFRLVDLDAIHNRILVSFPESGGGGGGGSGPTMPNYLQVYPMIPSSDGDNALPEDPRKYFPDPTMTITCQHPIMACAMDSVTGNTLLIATKSRTLEVWNLQANAATRTQILSCSNCLKESIQMRLAHRNTQPSVPKHKHKRLRRLCYRGVQDSAEAHAASSLYRQVTRLQGSSIESIHVAKHLSLEQSGFVTLQHSRTEGSSLLLWRFQEESSSFHITSLINLPLWSRRIPRIFYDGTRLIVFGQDQIGAIFLIYHCTATSHKNNNNELSPLVSPQEKEECDGDGSGGVYNLTHPPRGVQLANRIRHAALGGLDDYAMDSMHMTCNERFLMVNTRTGNLLGSSPVPEGLLVIDLQDTDTIQ